MQGKSVLCSHIIHLAWCIGDCWIILEPHSQPCGCQSRYDWLPTRSYPQVTNTHQHSTMVLQYNPSLDSYFNDIVKKIHGYHLHGFAIGFDRLGLIFFRSKSIRMLPCLNGWIHAIDRYLVLLHADNEFTFCEDV